MLKFFLFSFFLFSELFSAESENHIKNIFNSIDYMGLQKNTLSILKNEIKNYELDDNYYKTIFYFVDSDVTDQMIKKFSNGINRLKKLDPNINGNIMFRGLINDSYAYTANYTKKIVKEENITNVEFYPISFNSFKFFKLERVPAYALSECKKNFRFSECKHHYLIRGDISLQSFFEILMKNDKSYEKFYFILLEGQNSEIK